jgi:hypothetical protein
MTCHVERSRDIPLENLKMFPRGMESLASRTPSAALQPRLRFAPLGMT